MGRCGLGIERLVIAGRMQVATLGGYFSSIRTELILAGVLGRSLAPVGWVAILSTTSKPVVTLPKAVYWWSRWGESACMMKNWEPAELGSLVRAAERTPRVCLRSLNSALSL